MYGWRSRRSAQAIQSTFDVVWQRKLRHHHQGRHAWSADGAPEKQLPPKVSNLSWDSAVEQ